jgi:tetratricopeptide (TPR) repeat protein
MSRERTNTATAGVVTCLLVAGFLAGCDASDKTNAGPAPGAAREARTPYYPGLIAEYRRLLAEDPRNLAALIALGNAYFDSGSWKEAVRYYEQALRTDPRNVDVRTDLGTAYRNLGRYDQAIAEYRRVLTYQPEHQSAWYNLGLVYGYDKKNYAAAIRIWEDLLRMFPNHPQSEYMKSSIAAYKKILEKS